MHRILLFLYQYRVLFAFLILELTAAALYIANNNYARAWYFNSTSGLAVAVNGFTTNLRNYFALRDINRALAEENRLLREELMRQRGAAALYSGARHDSVRIHQFELIAAKVVNNSVSRFTNFLTIDRGLRDGVEPGMAVMGPNGIVGKVKACSNHYSVVTSLLNVDVMVSARLKRTGHFGTVQWDGSDPRYTLLKFIPRHVQPREGDSIVTTGYSGVFPENQTIGTVAEVELPSGSPFYNIRVRLAEDFGKLVFVTVVRNKLLPERDSLEHIIPDFHQ